MVDGNNPNLDVAVRLSAEELAQADAVWSARQRAGLERSARLSRMMHAGITHVDYLFRANMHSDAFATAALLQMPSVIDDAVVVCADSLMALNALAYLSLMTLMHQMPDDEHTRTHVHAIARYLCSMLYASYAEAKEHNTPDAIRWRPLAGNILSDAIGAGLVEWPSVDVNDVQVDCVEGRGLIVGDVLGRARALGLLNDE